MGYHSPLRCRTGLLWPRPFSVRSYCPCRLLHLLFFGILSLFLSFFSPPLLRIQILRMMNQFLFRYRHHSYYFYFWLVLLFTASFLLFTDLLFLLFGLLVVSFSRFLSSESEAWFSLF